ncbi:hypothetical protein FGO68_gene14430 [Halteria grandinella]|uniref:Uncharacterized protein n=1 Tax=Halteria grandinella TaxID=5974 RepID=A0A8J8P1Q0_HALGN|nr:hypothetical protein FGO68_gene14430 [Halteria grandinella]
MKRSTLRHLTMTYSKTSSTKKQLTSLQQSLRYCFESARQVCPPQQIKTRNGLIHSAPHNWVVAIVGQHQQELTRIKQYIKRAHLQYNINLVRKVNNILYQIDHNWGFYLRQGTV